MHKTAVTEIPPDCSSEQRITHITTQISYNLLRIAANANSLSLEIEM